MDWFSPWTQTQTQAQAQAEPVAQSETIDDLLGYDINLVKNTIAEINNVEEIKKYDRFYRNQLIGTTRYTNITNYINDQSIYSPPIPIRAIQDDAKFPVQVGKENSLVIYLRMLPFDVLKTNKNGKALMSGYNLKLFLKDEKYEPKKYEFALFATQQSILDEQLITTKKKSGFSYRKSEYRTIHVYSFGDSNYNMPFFLVSSNHEQPIRTVWVNLVEDEPLTNTSFPEKTPDEIAQQFKLSEIINVEDNYSKLDNSAPIQYVFPDNEYVKKVSPNTLFVDAVIPRIENKKVKIARKTRFFGRIVYDEVYKDVPYEDKCHFIIPKRINVYQKFVARTIKSVSNETRYGEDAEWGTVGDEIEIGNGKYLLLDRIDGGYTNDKGETFHWKDNYGNYYNLYDKPIFERDRVSDYNKTIEERFGKYHQQLHIDEPFEWSERMTIHGGKTRKYRKTSKKRKTNKSRRVQKQK